MIPDNGRRFTWPPAWAAPALHDIRRDLALWRGDMTREPDYPKDAVHVPIPADIATASADLLFAEPPVVKAITGDDTATHMQAVIDQIVNTSDMLPVLAEAGEIASATGGVYLRVGWDVSITDRPVAQVVDPDAAIPTFSLGVLREVTFWTDITDGDDTYRLLEDHRPGVIEYALFKGSDMLGQRLPLDSIPETAHLAAVVDAESTVQTGTSRLTALYIPNMRPAKRWRRTPMAAFGRSDYDDVRHLFTQADTVMGSWMRDIRLARARIVVPSDYLTPLGGGRGARFDITDEVFTGLPGMTLEESGGPIVRQFDIRVTEHQDTLHALTDIILRRAGLSQSTFGEQEGVETATGVKAKQQLSTRTRAKKLIYWRAALIELARVLTDVSATVYGTAPVPTDVRLDAGFPVETQVDADEAARTAQAMLTAQAASTATRVRLLHPDWSSERVNDEVAAIHVEFGTGPAGSPDLTRL